MAQTSEHTPGPWKAGYTAGKADEVYQAATFKRIAQCSAKGKSTPESTANALIMAASLDLLGAAKFAVENIEHSGCASTLCPPCDLESAVAKAEGR